MTQPYYSDDSVTLYHGDWRALTPANFRAGRLAAACSARDADELRKFLDALGLEKAS